MILCVSKNNLHTRDINQSSQRREKEMANKIYTTHTFYVRAAAASEQSTEKIGVRGNQTRHLHEREREVKRTSCGQPYQDYFNS